MKVTYNHKKLENQKTVNIGLVLMLLLDVTKNDHVKKKAKMHIWHKWKSKLLEKDKILATSLIGRMKLCYCNRFTDIWLLDSLGYGISRDHVIAQELYPQKNFGINKKRSSSCNISTGSDEIMVLIWVFNRNMSVIIVQMLEVHDWIKKLERIIMFLSDAAIQFGLICKIDGPLGAEDYLKNLHDDPVDKRAYMPLLKAYIHTRKKEKGSVASLSSLVNRIDPILRNVAPSGSLQVINPVEGVGYMLVFDELPSVQNKTHEYQLF
ncbi:hypothetical protein L1987_68695 [Smallanthus sonchifolius]|uniref:Uncharacterized protein n=1 Tax=Smallanthus sonchifolius TaxID=185202 RepID=A0ACB9B948_9ASTR|nr:hypothetical protein L1987_68695 [Smallanthus sonchifolius]